MHTYLYLLFKILKSYLKDVNRYPLLSVDEEKKLGKKIKIDVDLDRCVPDYYMDCYISLGRGMEYCKIFDFDYMDYFEYLDYSGYFGCYFLCYYCYLINYSH